jgi:uncharacterized protein YjbI with pentapeptide repeats
MNLADRVEEALRRFTFVAGSEGNPDKGTACPVSALSWVAKEEWSDHPDCAHPLICNVVIEASDDPSTTQEDLEALVWAGVSGLLDTAAVPTEVVLAAISGSRILHGLAGQPETPVSTALCVLAGVTAWKQGVRGNNLPLVLLRTCFVGASLNGLDLSGADLRYSNFDYADIAYTDLTGADMRHCMLRDAVLRDSDLSSADLSFADLRHASLFQARLSGTRFVGADLTAADMRRTVIDNHTDFTDARLASVLWPDLDPPPGWKRDDSRVYPLWPCVLEEQ